MKKIITAIIATIAALTLCNCSDSSTTEHYYYGIDVTEAQEVRGSCAGEALVTELTDLLRGFSGGVNVEDAMIAGFKDICKTHDNKGLLQGKVKLMRSTKIDDNSKLVNPKAIFTYTFTLKE